ncbi:ABC transporter permease [Herbidospora daliensis]|uniref:ABC transporter permease n=1 Tax=Herbidospora daliensis TaxID=295585 RepID=UPI00078359A0|nr:ABC transporter permease [Herbidospora daliensis]
MPKVNGASLLRGLIGTAGLLVVLEAAGRLGAWDTERLPLVSTVLLRAGELLTDPEFLVSARSSLTTWALALLVTIAIAVPAGLLLGMVKPAELAVRPLIEFLRPIPSVALIPLVILLYSETTHMRITVAVYAALWPVLINTIYGVRDVDPLAKETLRSFGFGPGSVAYRVVLPGAAPFIATGIRLAASVAIVLVVTSELIAGGIEGIGVYITIAASGNRLDLMIGATILVGLFGILVNAVLVAGENRLFRWHRARAGAAT